MKPIFSLCMQWSSRAVGGAKPGRALLAMVLAASSPMLVIAAEMPVSAVQETLQREGFFYSERSGVLDEPTRAALRRFQIRHGLPVSGEIDAATVQALQNPRSKDSATGAPASAPGAEPKGGSTSSPATIAKDREFLEGLQQSGAAPGRTPAVPPETPQVTSESTARIVSPRRAVEDDTEAPPRTEAPASEPTRRVVTRTTTTIVTAGEETDDVPDPLEPNGVRIIRPSGAVPVPRPTVPQERTRIVEEMRTTTVPPATPPSRRVPDSGLPIYPQADEPPSRVMPEAPTRKPQGFLQRLFRGDR